MHRNIFEAEIEKSRNFAREIDAAVRDYPGAQPCWLPLDDLEFWNIMDRIELIGTSHIGTKAEAEFLIGLVLIDDFGSLGRDLILAKASLLAVPQISEAVQMVLIECSPTTILYNSSLNKKKGMLKLIEASNLPVSIKPLEEMLSDSNPIIRRRAAYLYDKIISN